jgi:DNA-binding transcriptional MerR regulator
MEFSHQVYLLKDVSRLSGHSVHTLKFYLKRGLIKEAGWTPQTRFRYFTDTTLTRLSQIRTFRRQSKSLAHIQQVLGEQDLAQHDQRAVGVASDAGRGAWDVEG